MDGEAYQGVHMRVLYLQVSARHVIGLHVGERIMGVATLRSAQAVSGRGGRATGDGVMRLMKVAFLSTYYRYPDVSYMLWLAARFFCGDFSMAWPDTFEGDDAKLRDSSVKPPFGHCHLKKYL